MAGGWGAHWSPRGEAAKAPGRKEWVHTEVPQGWQVRSRDKPGGTQEAQVSEESWCGRPKGPTCGKGENAEDLRVPGGWRRLQDTAF